MPAFFPRRPATVAGLATVLAGVPVVPGTNTISITGTNAFGYPVSCTTRVLVVPEPAVLFVAVALCSMLRLLIQ